MYIDDIVVISKIVEGHVEHLWRVFDRLQTTGLKLHPTKCEFACPSVIYLGHVISADGI